MTTHINDFDSEAELDRARRNGEAIMRTHRRNAIEHDFGGGEDDRAELRQRVAEQFDLAPESFEGVDRATLETILATDREHTDRSPSADMRGRGGSGDGSPADSGEETKREHSAEPGRGSNGYPKKGRSNWAARSGRTATKREHSAEPGEVEKRRRRFERFAGDTSGS